ncbi:hypothetical protein DNH61_25060 [Paenibacillus sambharensis]|uniref:Phospholipid phosphatase n=1 Tax=Paenibacillus sambharensis TaxID=1803190 RepID=A0A2W1LDB5_9BACL|nr:hypothetical protein [Paenibacillus sambharensis]PZD93055.1 hypothetical protein DNH61_25060 [Paenibacillus sambharensis]
MDTILYLTFAAAYAVMLAWGLVLFRSDRHWGLQYLLLLVTSGLLWDNGLIGTGRWIGEGPLLESLSLSRFWLHAFLTPLLALVSYGLIRQAGSSWARKPAAWWGAWLFTAALIVLELVTETLSVRLKPLHEYGVLRYVPIEQSGPPLMVILILIPLFTAGVVLWRRLRSPWLFIGTLLMLAGSAIPIPLDSSAATNLFELLLILSLWVSVYQVRRAG